MRRFPFICLLALLWPSCSVKEARQDCPCLVEVDLQPFSEVTGVASLDLNGYRMERQLRDEDSLTVQRLLPAGDRFSIRVWSGVSRMRRDGTLLKVEEGTDCDSLFLFWTALPGRQEQTRVQAWPRKQFASVLLKVFPDEDQPAPSRYTVRSNYASIDLNEGRPVPGRLRIPLAAGAAEHRFCLPRQARDGQLLLEADDGAGNHFAYPLGEWILAAGYDWTAPDLADIVVGADFMQGKFEVTVLEWEPGDMMRQML